MTDELLPQPTEDQLTKLLEPFDWDDFENTIDGHRKITVADRELMVELSHMHYDFYLRVGMFMNRAMRVVMACGKYVWMKEEKLFNLCNLMPLNPGQSKGPLYPTGLLDMPMGWRPIYQTTAAGQYGLAGLAGLQGVGGYGGVAQIPTTWVSSPVTTTNTTTYIPYTQVTTSTYGALVGQAQTIGPYGGAGGTGSISNQGLGYAPSLPRVK